MKLAVASSILASFRYFQLRLSFSGHGPPNGRRCLASHFEDCQADPGIVVTQGNVPALLDEVEVHVGDFWIEVIGNRESAPVFDVADAFNLLLVSLSVTCLPPLCSTPI
mmetsp:Transcript_136913/g.273089  ORF Transcript_136913/g.273089 Transcript_136913/m.273089 type:complete len:109 (+) Transcript_136913:574-900(+)